MSHSCRRNGPNETILVYVVIGCCLFSGILPPAGVSADTDSLSAAAEAAHKWLQAAPSDRDRIEPVLANYSGDIDAVIREIMPKGRPDFAGPLGHEIKGDTFTVPELLARNKDHPFNYYVPAHYDPSKPMGLILWMHGGGTYKPGKNINLETAVAGGEEPQTIAPP